MAKRFYIDCPFCEGLMEVDAASGKVLQKWGPEERPQKGGDKLSSALQKLTEDKKKRSSLFQQKQDELKGSKSKLEDQFRKEVDKVKKEGVKDNPFRPFDLD